MSRIYVASSWRNLYQPAVLKLLTDNGHEVYDFRNPPNATGFSWKELDPNWTQWSMEQYRQMLLTERAVEGFGADMNGLRWCDTCLLVLPCGRSAHLEAGWAIGNGKRLIIYIPEHIEPDLMYLMADKICLYVQEILEALK